MFTHSHLGRLLILSATTLGMSFTPSTVQAQLAPVCENFELQPLGGQSPVWFSMGSSFQKPSMLWDGSTNAFFKVEDPTPPTNSRGLYFGRFSLGQFHIFQGELAPGVYPKRITFVASAFAGPWVIQSFSTTGTLLQTVTVPANTTQTVEFGGEPVFYLRFEGGGEECLDDLCMEP
jgi:hypothetical protein